MISKLSTAAAVVASASAVDLALEAEQGAKSCSYGKDSVMKSPSNSWTAFKDAQSASGKWEDPEFKADDDSLYWPNRPWGQWMDESFVQPSRRIPGGRRWKRPSQMGGTNDDGVIYKKNPSLWGDKGISPAGVRQHAVGDCWFLAAASALAEVPERVERIFWNTEYDKNGIFRVYLFMNGDWVGINIDDRLPMHYDKRAQHYGMPTNNIPYGSRASIHNAWWMAILEKAFAKAHINYDRIVGGLAGEALRKLTGMPTVMLHPRIHDVMRDQNRAKKAIALYAKKNYPIGTGCCQQEYGGLYNGHAYTLLDFHKFKNGEELVKIRNPHAAERYQGKWSDRDRSWTAEMKAEIGGHVAANDGTFWMSFYHWYHVMGRVHVTFWDDFGGYKKEEHKIGVHHQDTYTVTNPTTQNLFISYDQWGDRSVPKKNCAKGYKRPMVVQLFNPQGQKIAQSLIDEFQSTLVGGFEGELPAGQYKLVLINQDNKPHDFQLHYYWGKTAGTASAAGSRRLRFR